MSGDHLTWRTTLAIVYALKCLNARKMYFSLTGASVTAARGYFRCCRNRPQRNLLPAILSDSARDGWVGYHWRLWPKGPRHPKRPSASTPSEAKLVALTVFRMGYSLFLIELPRYARFATAQSEVLLSPWLTDTKSRMARYTSVYERNCGLQTTRHTHHQR